MKKILHIITSLGGGGAEKSLFNLLTNGLENDYENYVICLSTKGIYTEKLLKKNIKVIHINMRGFFSSIKQIITLAKICKIIQPSLIQGWMYHGNLISLILSIVNFNKIPVAINIRQALDNEKALNFRTKFINKICAFLSIFSCAIISNSKRALSHHHQIGYVKKNNFIINNGFDTSLFKKITNNKLLNDLEIKDNDFVIGFLGRNHYQKNFDLLLSVFLKIQRKYKNIKLLCIGEGFKNYAKKNKNKNIKYLGYKNEVYKYINLFDILCMTSLWEGFPNVIGEAMSCEVPCIASNVGDCSYLINNKNLIFKSGCKDELYKKIISLYEMKKEDLRKLGKQSRQRIINNFSIESNIAEYKKLYKKLNI